MPQMIRKSISAYSFVPLIYRIEINESIEITVSTTALRAKPVLSERSEFTGFVNVRQLVG